MVGEQMRQPYTTQSPILANYDYTDIASGTGYETYYLIESEDSGGKDYHLTGQNDYSSSVLISKNNGTSDLDYDLTPFIIPRTINGTALISLAVGGNMLGGSATFTVELYRVPKTGPEDQIGSTISRTIALTAAEMIYFRMDVSNELIAEGEMLRARVQLSNATALSAYYGIDPAGRTDASLTITTQSKIHIPFKLDL